MHNLIPNYSAISSMSALDLILYLSKKNTHTRTHTHKVCLCKYFMNFCVSDVMSETPTNIKYLNNKIHNQGCQKG